MSKFRAFLRQARNFLRSTFKERVDIGARGAEEIRKAIENLAPEFKLVPTSTEVEGGYDPNVHYGQPKDYEVFYKGRLICYLDVTRSDYSFDHHKPTSDIPVRKNKIEFAKGKRLPFYLVYDLSLEPFRIEDRCRWITAKEASKYPLKTLETRNGAIRYNYNTDKYAWKKGLKSLVEEWRKLVYWDTLNSDESASR